MEPVGPAGSGGRGPLEARHVYVLMCADGQLYTGSTGDLEERMGRHRRGEVPATVGRRPVELCWSCWFPDKYAAYRFEKFLKSGSGRAFVWKRLLEARKPPSG